MDEVGAGGLGVEEGHRTADPHGLGDPGEGGGDGGDRAAEGPARPQVDAALAGEGRAGLGEDEGVGHEEEGDEEDEPGEGLGALGRDRAEHLEADDGREDEEDDVEAAEGALKAPGLPLRHARVGGVIVLGHCCPSRSRTQPVRRPAVLRPEPHGVTRSIVGPRRAACRRRPGPRDEPGKIPRTEVMEDLAADRAAQHMSRERIRSRCSWDDRRSSACVPDAVKLPLSMTRTRSESTTEASR